MTITVNPTRNEYTATAGQTVFNYTFKIFDSGDLNVYQTPAGQEANDQDDLITGYSVTGVGNSAGGSITLNTPAFAGDLITIVSNISDSRTTDYPNNGDFVPDTVNNDFDRVVSLTKQQKNQLDRTPQFPESLQNATDIDWAAPVTGGFIRWQDNGDGTFSLINVNLNTAEDATNAAAVSISDSAGIYTATDVEGALAEMYTVIRNGIDNQQGRYFPSNVGFDTDSGLPQLQWKSDSSGDVQAYISYLDGFGGNPQMLISCGNDDYSKNLDIRIEPNGNSPADADGSFTFSTNGDPNFAFFYVNMNLSAKTVIATDFFQAPNYANLAAINAAIPTAQRGMMVSTSAQGMAYYNGTNWVEMTDNSTLIT